MKIRNKFAMIAAAVAVTTLTMAVVPVLMTSSTTTTIVQSAWAQEIPEIPDASSLIEQHDVPNASELLEEHRPVIPAIPQDPRFNPPELGFLPR
jgi:hypothetical protein